MFLVFCSRCIKLCYDCLLSLSLAHYAFSCVMTVCVPMSLAYVYLSCAKAVFFPCLLLAFTLVVLLPSVYLVYCLRLLKLCYDYLCFLSIAYVYLSCAMTGCVHCFCSRLL